VHQGCQIFIGPNIPKQGKNTKYVATNFTKRPYIIQNGYKIFQMAIKYNNILHSKALQNIPKFGVLV
jgi:CRISPR/Cas system-associated protein endoribonuclease Cas2